MLQGSVLSPLLYSVYLDPLVEKLKAEGPQIPLYHIAGGINCLLYADDIVLIADSSASLKKLLAIAEADANERGYRFSAAKCVVVAPGRPRHKLYGQVLDRKDVFTYLGVEVSCKGLSRMDHVKKRIEKAEAAVKSLRASGARPGSLPARALIQLYKSVVRPSLEYGLPLLSDHLGALQALDRSQRCIFKSWLGLPSRSLELGMVARLRPDIGEKRFLGPELGSRQREFASQRGPEIAASRLVPYSD